MQVVEHKGDLQRVAATERATEGGRGPIELVGEQTAGSTGPQRTSKAVGGPTEHLIGRDLDPGVGR